MVFQDVDGDGNNDLIITSGDCTLSMHSLYAWGREVRYRNTGLSTEDVLTVLDQSIKGSELATAFRVWRDVGCPQSTEDGGELWSNIAEAISTHQQTMKKYTAKNYKTKDKYFSIFYNDSVPSLLFQ